MVPPKSEMYDKNGVAVVHELQNAVMPKGTVDAKRWIKYRNLRRLNFLLIFPLISIFTLGFDGSLMNGLQAIEPWRAYFGEPKGAVLGLFNGAYPLGGICAVPLISFVNDGYGRRWGIAAGAIICCFGAALQGAAQNLAMFVIARAFIGAGSTLISATGAPLITELAHPDHRTTATALFQTSYALGSIVAAWITFGTFRINGDASWRIPSALQALPSVIQLLGIFFVPESPRWLVSKDRSAEALATLAKYHAEGDANDPLVQFEYHEITEALQVETSAMKSNWVQNYLEFAKSPGNRRRFFILIWCACLCQMSGNAIISYYLAPILASIGLTSSLQQTLINATNQMLSWFAALYFATLPAKVGRRPLFLAALICVLLCLIAITTGSAVFAKSGDNRAAGYAVLVFIYLFSPAYNLGLNGNLGLYITEILPFTLRLRGMAVFQFSQLCFILLSVFAIPVGLQAIQWRFYTFFIAWVVVEFIVVWFVFPETKGPTLEEIAIIFDGPQKATFAVAKHIEATAGSEAGFDHVEVNETSLKK